MTRNLSWAVYFLSVLLRAILPFSRQDTLTTSRPGSIRLHTIAEGKTVSSYNPPNVFETYGSPGIDAEFFAAALSDSQSPIKNAAASFLEKKLSVNRSSLVYRSGYTADQGHYAYYSLSYENIPVANSVANVGFNRLGEIVSFGSSFIDSSFESISSIPSIDILTVMPVIEDLLKGQYNFKPPALEYYVLANGSVALTYVVEIVDLNTAKWYEVFVDAHTGELVSLTDFVAAVSYYAVDIHKASVSDGQSMLRDPDDRIASPLGWLNNGTFNFTVTSGNNGQVFKHTSDYEYTPADPFPFSDLADPSSNLTYTYPFDPALPPELPEPESQNLDAARTNGFYILNTMHDIAYRYGFTEDSFNFQVTTLQGAGTGKGGDPVMMSVQASAAGKNNAWFATPGDGSPGFCVMLLWTFTFPERDGALSNDIVVHEMTHGITNRMTGGGTGRCLQDLESQGLGEGWSDAMADWTELRSADVQDYTIGTYVTGNFKGIRKYPYSTNPTVNPLRYSSLQGLTEPHSIGEVWANMLHNLLAALVDAYGWSAIATTSPEDKEGNIVYLHLFIDALALQPCNPTFVQARNAIIQADQVRYGGQNMCLIWNVFASRGLGVNATDWKDDGNSPESCENMPMFKQSV